MVLVASAVCAQTPGAVARVEAGLRPAVQIAGEPEARWSIQERLAHHKVAAVSVAVISGGKVEWAKAYGVIDATTGVAANPDTLFQAASISKPVSAIAALRMVAAGQLSLDEDVNVRLLSSKVPPHSFGKPVTLRGLLSHTAGTTVHGFPGYAADAPVATAVQVLAGEKPANTAKVIVDIEPGSTWRYSGGGYTVMQVLMSDVAKKPFAAILRESVLDRLEMTRSTFEQPLPESLHTNAARAHGRDGKPIAGRWHTYPEQAAAALWTTPTDLAKVLLAMQRAHAGEAKLLPTGLTREMLTAVKGDYGLGWGLRGTGENLAFSHGGANAGFRCFAFAYAGKGKGAVVMTNSDSGDALASEILRSIAAEYGWPDYKVETRTPLSLSAERLSAYAGEYQAPMGIVAVSVHGKGIRIEMGGRNFDFQPESDTKFFPVTDGAPSLVFSRDADGKITGFAGGNLKASRKE
ncbi:MAG: serine hydrolase [Bryobacteraceae bacterium]|nr:serine hydrolase [Bryobacteraceae bacterium]